MADKDIDLKQLRSTLFSLLKPERSFFGVVVAYNIATGLMTLAVPIAVQTLINTVVNMASPRSVVILAIVLFCTLALSAFFAALRTEVMEYYERRVYARLVAELSLRTILAPRSFFEGRRNTSTAHRYFDIITLQKNVPALVVDGNALILQMFVGFTLVAFYHPFLLAFNLFVLLLVWVIWRIWSGPAKRSAVRLSEAKYYTANWLSNLAAAHEYTKSASQFDYASQKTEAYVAQYTALHEKHFSFTFKQVVLFYALYALASSALLGLGGWLVIAGQLSIGQLVAAELIMSAVFLGLSRFPYYLKLYYELYGTADKLGSVLSIPQESLEQTSKPAPVNGAIYFNNVIVENRDEMCTLDFSIDSKEKVFVTTQNNWTQSSMIRLLKRYLEPKRGWIKLGGYDLNDLDSYELRQAVFVLDRSLIIECSITEYLKMSASNITKEAINNVIEQVGLYERICSLPDGFNTQLSAVGAPLGPMEFIQLKLASALLGSPKVLIINQHFDTIPQQRRQALMDIIANMNTTVLYFTNAADTAVFSRVIDIMVQPNANALPTRLRH
ncbi:ABC transporter transmembrane domain-containing protein [Halioxenophilus aromaticivorans]|uniref:ABC transporter ATP-binding protein n=1 Tax=Halioxenophilus aromaticivorans TaxID=1306992 RepID=A0AAV3TZA4_9ALTE